MPRGTTAHVGGVQAVPAHRQLHVCVCEHSAPSPPPGFKHPPQQQQRTSRPHCLWEEAHSQSRTSPTCVLRRVTGPLPSIAGTKRQGTGPSHASTDTPFLSSMKCVWHIGCKGPLHTALCCAPLSVLHSRLSWSMQPHQHRQQQMRMRLSPLLARVTAASAADACARQQADRSHCH